MTSVTTIAGAIGFGMYDIAIAGGVEHMGRHPMGSGADPNPRFLVREARERSTPSTWAAPPSASTTASPQLTKERADRFALGSQQKAAAAYEAGKIQPDLIPVAIKTAERLGSGDARRGTATRDDASRVSPG